MKLTRIRIEQVRQFRNALEIRDLDDGINLITGPNESGKSSIVRAIRAAFLERHRSSSVDDLRPWGDSSAAPTVDLQFETGGNAYGLTKSFLNKKRCELRIGSQRYESAEAEDRVAELLGFQFASKGASKPEHWGIPGLLWIEQGQGQQVQGAVEHATDHLRSALNESLGEVTSNGGDEILDRVRTERAELLTATGKPTGQLSKVSAELAELRQRQVEVDSQINLYRQQVDALADLREQQTIEEKDRPWEGLRAELVIAEEKSAAAEKLSESLTADKARAGQLNATLELLRHQLADLDKQEKDLVAREASLGVANDALEKAKAALVLLQRREEAADASYKAARELLRLSRQEGQRSACQQSIADAEKRLQVLVESIKTAKAAQAELIQAQELVKQLELSKADLSALKLTDRKLRDIEIRKASMATSLHFDLLPGKDVLLGDERIEGMADRLLITAGSLEIPGHGKITITPGGTDLAELARELDEAQEAYADLLRRMGVVSLEDAETRHIRYQQAELDVKRAGQSLSLHAPKGVDVLLAEEQEINARLITLRTTLEELPPPPAELVPGEEKAQEDQDRARESLDAVSREVNDAKQSLASLEADRDNAQREKDSLVQSLADPARVQRQQNTNQSLIDTKASLEGLSQRIAEQEKAVLEARPDILKQDIERLRRSADQMERSFRLRGEEIIRLQTQLETLGAQGLEEQGALLGAQVEQLSRRENELTRRAQALDLLLNLLEGKRRELTRRLQAPLQKHLNHYLHLLFPQANLEIDEDLSPGPFTRTSVKGNECGDFEEMSFGAREQLGVISRLAYADLLKEAGRPTLIILDDALVHSDEERLSQMKRILFDAAQRHQILLFSCHPKSWRDLGVTPRSISSLIVS